MRGLAANTTGSEVGVASCRRRRPFTDGLPEHPAVVAAVLASVAAVIAPVHAAIDAVRHDGGRSDDGRGSRHRPADHASASDTSWAKRHLRFLP